MAPTGDELKYSGLLSFNDLGRGMPLVKKDLDWSILAQSDIDTGTFSGRLVGLDILKCP
jgi:hypothetical protein